MIPPPPSPFPPITRLAIPAGTVVHRIHGRSFDPDRFNPCQGRPTRFAPLFRSDGSCIPTAYGAQSLECAAHETVFHEIQHGAARKTIDADAVAALDHSTVSASRGLTLCCLFEPDLNRWELTRRDLVDTFASAYQRTALWASAIHDAHSDIDGLVWTSRRCDPVLAYVLFGDRLGGNCLEVLSRQRIGTTPALLSRLREFGSRAGITLVV